MSIGLTIIPNAGPTSASAAAATTTSSAGATSGAVGVDDFEALVFDDGAGQRLPYRLYRPQLRDGQKAPLILFLHGAGGRGTDNRKQLTDQSAPLVFVQPENQRRWPAFFIAPQCPENLRWVEMPWDSPSGKGQRPSAPSWPMAATLALVDKLVAELPAVDSTRLFVTGISMGGFGTFDAAARRPDRWRAAVPICGGYDEAAIAPLLRLPLWAFHAEDDPTVPVARTRTIVEALRALGGHPRYTEYPASAGHGHFSWIPAYAEPELLPWMFGAARVDAPSGPRDPSPPVSPGRQQRQRGCGCSAVPITAAPVAGEAAAATAAAVVSALFVMLRRRLRNRR